MQPEWRPPVVNKELLKQFVNVLLLSFPNIAEYEYDEVWVPTGSSKSIRPWTSKVDAMAKVAK
jgi:hypothetical protein